MLLCLLSAGLIFAAGWFASSRYCAATAGKYQHRRVKASGYRLTSPLLDVELPEGLSVHNEPISYKFKVKDLVKKRIDGKKICSLSVYYRDLLDGPWFGINEKEEFNPASMMKVPVMIAWLKRAEKDPAALSTTFVFSGKEDMSAVQIHKPQRTLEAGKRYTVEDLLKFMLSYSDNNATKLLYENMSGAELDAVLDSMDINNNPNASGNSITVHGYSGFFRILYNSSFLNREYSEKALQLLTMEDFPEGITAGVPQGTVVAAKFGEYEEDRVLQLHEFGIVYHPRGSYILGVMTKGSDSALQAAAIRDISELIYKETASAQRASFVHAD